MIKTASLTSILVLCLLALPAMAQSNAAQQSLDAVCKSDPKATGYVPDPMPAGYVPVGEMESSECKASEPNKKNAWLIDKVRENIVSCERPNYGKGYPPAIAYMACERVQASLCPPVVDGTPNGFRLTAGTSCRDSRVKTECLNWELAQTGFSLYRTEKKPEEGVPRFNVNHPDEELEFFVLNVVRNDPTCQGAPNSTGSDRMFYVSDLREDGALPLCLAFNEGRDYSHLLRRIASHNANPHDTKINVRRQFYTELCPPFIKDGKTQALNAVVVSRWTKKEWSVWPMYMCAAGLPKKPKVPVEIIPGSGGMVVEETDVHAYSVSTVYTVKEVSQNDWCGTGEEPNMYTVQFNE